MVNRGEPLKIMLDPGHGGRDPGAVRDGVRESDIVLDIALRCRDILKKWVPLADAALVRGVSTTTRSASRYGGASGSGHPR